jgi:hypothetical protein
VDGARVEIADADRGVELTVTAEEGAAQAEVRRRAAHLAEVSAGRAREAHGRGQGGGFMRNCPVVTKNTQITVRDVPGGAVLRVVAQPPLDEKTLRAEARERLARLPLPRAQVVSEKTPSKGEVRYYSAVLADLDGKGAPELVAGGFEDEGQTRHATVPVFRAHGGKWQMVAAADWSEGDHSTIRNVAVADLDGDGRDEVVALGRTGSKHREHARLAVLSLESDRVVRRAEIEWESGEYCHGYGLDIGDLDGDGRPEIATGGFSFDGKRETGFVRAWSFAHDKLSLRAAITLDGEGESSMRVNGIAVGDLDGGVPEIVVAGRRGPLKNAATRADHSLRREQADLTVLAFEKGKLVKRARKSWAKGSTTRLRSVVVADLDGVAPREIVAAGQYEGAGKPFLVLLGLDRSDLALRFDASPPDDIGEIKNLFVDGEGASARVIASGPTGDKPARQAVVETWQLRGGKLVKQKTMTSRNGDETRPRAALVVPGAGGDTVLTIGHALKGKAMVGQVLAWQLP